MRYKAVVPTLILLLTTLNGCGATRASRYYQLTVPSEKTSAVDPPPYPVTLLLGPISTSHLYRDDRIIFTSTSEAMGAYEYQKWAEPPAEMVNDVLLRELRASGRFEHVYSLHSNVRGDYVLRGFLYDFREVTGNGDSARVAFEFELRDSKTGATVWSHSYSHDEPVNQKEVSAVVAALDRNVQSGLAETMGGLAQYFLAHTQATAGVR